MTIEYIGRNNKYYENEKPMAVIGWNEEKEGRKADLMYMFLSNEFTDVYCEDEMMVVPVTDKEDYRFVLNKYKEFKKRINKVTK